MFGPIEIKGSLELVRPHISILGSNNMVRQLKTLKTRSSSAQFNVHTTYQEQARYVKGSLLRASVLFLIAVPPHSFSSKVEDLFSHQPYIPTKVYLGIVRAHRATAAQGAAWGAVLRDRKQVMTLLLRPRLHEIHHRAVPAEAEKIEEKSLCHQRAQ